jgi:hypothetical protein
MQQSIIEEAAKNTNYSTIQNSNCQFKSLPYEVETN